MVAALGGFWRDRRASMFAQYSMVRVKALLQPDDAYNGWGVNRRVPAIERHQAPLLMSFRVPCLPTAYVVECSNSDGATEWLADFVEDELDACET